MSGTFQAGIDPFLPFCQLALAVIAFVTWVPNTLEMVIGFLFVPGLGRVAPLRDEECPSLSVVVPACNEAATIEPAMRSLQRLDYPGLQLIAVEDRSTDRTGEILDRLAGEDSRLQVLHLHELPQGWLGKNHALQRGSEEATGEWVLFTDADVVYEPDALRRAMAVAISRRADHLVVLPRLILEQFWEKSFVSFFIVMFNFRFRPWQASWKWGRGYIGVGAFSLVRRNVYEALGCHRRLRMEVADDVKLGKMIRRAGYRQVVAGSDGLVAVRWAVGLHGVLQGLMKNAFAGVGYSWPVLIGSSAAVVASTAWPLAGLFTGPPIARALSAASLGGMLLAAAGAGKENRVPFYYALSWPVTALLFVWVLIRSGLLAEQQGGIYWRGTFYALEELRRNTG